ncbi:MAG: hypothetical protein ACW98K_17250 [Candidatus Kariarchaeaceae archaeon]|jgi:hypothetical protein
MSKVYSFRLSEDNPRETQAREIIEAWVNEGYSLRQVIVDVLLSYKKVEVGHDELNSIVEQLQYLILSLGKGLPSSTSESGLTNSFLNALKQSVREGVRVE